MTSIRTDNVCDILRYRGNNHGGRVLRAWLFRHGGREDKENGIGQAGGPGRGQRKVIGWGTAVATVCLAELRKDLT